MTSDSYSGSPERAPRRPGPRVDLSQQRRIHVVGIGGPGMSALAIVLHEWGHAVSGSDVRQSRTTQTLSDMGIQVFIGHDSKNVHGAEIVTYSTAIPFDNVELTTAQKMGVTVLHRGDVLGSMCATRNSIGVAGTHGKTTTSALLMQMLYAGGEEVSYVIGAKVRETGTGAAAGSSNIMVVEMDESDGTAEVIPVESLIVTNIDVDHLDYFGTEENIRHVFSTIVSQVPGAVVMCADDKNCQAIIDQRRNQQSITSYGFSDWADASITSFVNTATGIRFEFQYQNETHIVELPLRGRHNALNCLAAILMSFARGVSINQATLVAQTFAGVERRFDERAVVRDALMIDDYAHLPAEIEAALSAATGHPRRTGKLIAVFQPNRFHRIENMANDYADCFHEADIVVITDIYASGTTPIAGVTGERVVNAVLSAHPDAHVIWAPTRQQVITEVLSHLSPGDVCISMGCGDIGQLPDEIASAV